MAEYIEIPGIIVGDSVFSTTIAKNLAEAGKLPHDFEFRLLGIDTDVRQDVANQDILAALDMGPGSGEAYLIGPPPKIITKPLRDCSWQSILKSVDEDYHTLYTLRAIAQEIGRGDAYVKSIWARYVQHINPNLYKKCLDTCKDERDIEGPTFYQMGRVAIHDNELLEIYTRNSLTGHGPVRRSLLRLLLLDNHPELGIDI